MEKVTLWILLMACVTFSVRYAFFVRFVPIKLNRHVRQILVFTAPCVLTAMWTPIVFGSTVSGVDLLNPYLFGGVFAVIASLLIENTLLVIVLSVFVFYTLRYLIG